MLIVSVLDLGFVGKRNSEIRGTEQEVTELMKTSNL